MPSERMQRRIDAFLTEADEAATSGDWRSVAEKARAVLAIDEGNEDASAFLKMAEANQGAPAAGPAPSPAAPPRALTDPPIPSAASLPESFGAGRFRVLRFLGEGGKKKVFLAHDALLDRDVAFSLRSAASASCGRRRRWGAVLLL